MLLHCSPVQATGLTTLIWVRGGLNEQPKTATGRGAHVPDMERLRQGMCDRNRPDPNRKAGNADLEGKERQGRGASQTMMGKRQLRPDPVKARRQNSKYPGRGTTPVRARSDRSQTKGERITQWPGGPQSEPARGAKGHTQETKCYPAYQTQSGSAEAQTWRERSAWIGTLQGSGCTADV